MRKIIILIVLFMNGCASTEKSIATGAIAGGIGGVVNGYHLTPITRKGTFRGALIGAGIGGLTGFIIHNYLEEKYLKIRRETLFNLDKHDILNPPPHWDITEESQWALPQSINKRRKNDK